MGAQATLASSCPASRKGSLRFLIHFAPRIHWLLPKTLPMVPACPGQDRRKDTAIHVTAPKNGAYPGTAMRSVL